MSQSGGSSSGTMNRAKRPKRPNGEVRRLLLAAAKKRFAANGYLATKTNDIAADACVAEALLFRHFGTKAGLFEEAVVRPFQEAIEGFLAEWEEMRRRAELDPEVSLSEDFVARSFIEAMFDLLSDQGGLLVMLMLGIEQFNAESNQKPRNPLLPLLYELERVGAYEAGRHGWPGNVQVKVRAIFAMVAFNAAFDDLLYSDDARRPSQHDIVEELIAFSVAGSHRSSPQPQT